MNPSRVTLAATAALCLFTGCTTTVRYVVRTETADDPTVTVIPASIDARDMAAADNTTELLLAAGIRVVERPAMVDKHTEYKGTTSGGGVGVTPGGQVAVVGLGGGQQGQVTVAADPVTLIGLTSADYVVFAKAGRWLKVVRRTDGRVLYAGTLGAEDEPSGCCLTGSFWRQLTDAPDDTSSLSNLFKKLDILK